MAEIQGFVPGIISACGHEVGQWMDIGEYERARSVVEEALQDAGPGNPLGLLYGDLCRTWFCHRSSEGLQWARKYLDGVAAFFIEFPTDGGHLRTLVRGLGSAERIFREAGREEEFRQRIEDLIDQLSAAGYRTAGTTWLLGDPVDLPGLAQPIAGDFTLQATIHAGSEVQESVAECRRAKAAGGVPPRASASPCTAACAGSA